MDITVIDFLLTVAISILGGFVVGVGVGITKFASNEREELEKNGR